MKRILIPLFAALLFAAPVYAQTDPTPEVTPVVIESNPVIIPDDSTVVVIEAPETPAEPSPTETETPGGYALAILATAVIMALVFTPIASFLAKSIPASLIPVFVEQGRTLAKSGQEYAKTTETPLDNIAFDELLKQIDKLEGTVSNLQVQVRANTANIENQLPGK